MIPRLTMTELYRTMDNGCQFVASVSWQYSRRIDWKSDWLTTSKIVWKMTLKTDRPSPTNGIAVSQKLDVVFFDVFIQVLGNCAAYTKVDLISGWFMLEGKWWKSGEKMFVRILLDMHRKNPRITEAWNRKHLQREFSVYRYNLPQSAIMEEIVLR